MSGSDIFTGTLDLLILKAVAQEPLHGYAIGRWIRQQSNEILQIEEGALYPALHRLERRGMLTSDWGESETGRRAKFYILTPSGREALSTGAERWSLHSEAVRLVLGGAES